ncbi:MAG: glycosyltransferase [Verrucomicrobia bacterium]|nr:glycosyltransferase [Verrucomicrobiota bacterium]
MYSAPSVTVLMTVYNGGKFLAESIISILSQGFRDYEFLIIDDASSDGSVVMLKEFAAKDGRIRLIINERNKGQTACLNQGLREARGEWIARQDADDISMPKRLQLEWEETQKIPSLMIVGVNGWVIDGEGACTGMIHAPLTEEGIRWALPFRNPFIHAGVMFHRLWPDGSPVLYDEEYRICQDWELWGRLLEQGGGINLPQRLVAYRHQEGSLSRGNLERTRHEAEAITSKLWQKSFPAHLPDQELLASFREGLDVRHRRNFWRLYKGLSKECSRKKVSQATAVHHFQAAGALGPEAPFAMIAELLKAFVSEPLWSVRAIGEGIFRPRSIIAS